MVNHLKFRSTDLKSLLNSISLPVQVTRNDLANELWNMSEMLPMELKPGDEYHITL
jgi:hypothetical protein